MGNGRGTLGLLNLVGLLMVIVAVIVLGNSCAQACSRTSSDITAPERTSPIAPEGGFGCTGPGGFTVGASQEVRDRSVRLLTDEKLKAIEAGQEREEKKLDSSLKTLAAWRKSVPWVVGAAVISAVLIGTGIAYEHKAPVIRAEAARQEALAVQLKAKKIELMVEETPDGRKAVIKAAGLSPTEIKELLAAKTAVFAPADYQNEQIIKLAERIGKDAVIRLISEGRIGHYLALQSGGVVEDAEYRVETDVDEISTDNSK